MPCHAMPCHAISISLASSRDYQQPLINVRTVGDSQSSASLGTFQKWSVFHAARNIYFQNDTDIPPSQPPIFVAGSCMLCAALIAFWWFYTRKCCSRVQRFIRSTPEPEDEERFDEKFSRFGDGPYSKWYENCFTQTCHSVLLFRSLI
jgi:hypothetical protein